MANFTSSAALSAPQFSVEGEENDLCNWIVVCDSDAESDGVISLDDYDFDSPEEDSSLSNLSGNHRSLDPIVDLDGVDQSPGSIQDLDEVVENQTLGSSNHDLYGIGGDESVGVIPDLVAVREFLRDINFRQYAFEVDCGFWAAAKAQEEEYAREEEEEEEEVHEDDDAGDEGYGLDDELIPWTVSGKFGRQRMRKLGKRACAKMNTTKKSPYLYVKPGCVRGKHASGSKRNY